MTGVLSVNAARPQVACDRSRLAKKNWESTCVDTHLKTPAPGQKCPSAVFMQSLPHFQQSRGGRGVALHEVAMGCPWGGCGVAVGWLQDGRGMDVGWPCGGRRVAVGWPQGGRGVAVGWPWDNRGVAVGWPCRGIIMGSKLVPRLVPRVVPKLGGAGAPQVPVTSPGTRYQMRKKSCKTSTFAPGTNTGHHSGHSTGHTPGTAPGTTPGTAPGTPPSKRGGEGGWRDGRGGRGMGGWGRHPPPLSNKPRQLKSNPEPCTPSPTQI